MGVILGAYGNINLSSFNTSKVINMNGLFALCENLKYIDLSSFDNKNLMNMSFMFSECYNLEKLILTPFRSDINLEGIFRKCYKLKAFICKYGNNKFENIYI